MTKDSSAENDQKFEVNVFSDQVSVSIYEKLEPQGIPFERWLKYMIIKHFIV